MSTFEEWFDRYRRSIIEGYGFISIENAYRLYLAWTTGAGLYNPPTPPPVQAPGMPAFLTTGSFHRNYSTSRQSSPHEALEPALGRAVQ